MKCEGSELNVYNILSGLWGIATFVFLVKLCVYWGCKYEKKDYYCSYAWSVFVIVFILFGGCFLLYSIGMAIFQFATSIMVYRSYGSFANVNQTEGIPCSPIVYYFSFASVTLAYLMYIIVAIVSCCFCIVLE